MGLERFDDLSHRTKILVDLARTGRHAQNFPDNILNHNCAIKIRLFEKDIHRFIFIEKLSLLIYMKRISAGSNLEFEIINRHSKIENLIQWGLARVAVTRLTWKNERFEK